MIHYFDLISLFFSYFHFSISGYASHLFIPLATPPPLLFFIFMDEFRILSYLGFTYTTYITVKSDFINILILNIWIYKKSKIKNLKKKY